MHATCMLTSNEVLAQREISFCPSVHFFMQYVLHDDTLPANIGELNYSTVLSSKGSGFEFTYVGRNRLLR
jgi:hypothetical protein